MTSHTDFSQFSHAQLVAMLFAGDPKTARSAGSVWDLAGGALHDRANDLDRQLHGFTEKWEGGAAQQYHTMIGDLASGIRKVATTAFDLRDLTYSSAESLEEAQRTMPQPVSVPDLSPTTVQAATTPLSSDPSLSQDTQQKLAVRQAQAVRQVSEHQQAAKAANSAHQQAVQVMSTLAGHYTATEQTMPVAPQASPTQTVPVDDTDTRKPSTLPASNPSLQPTGNDTNTTLPAIVGGGAIAGAATSPLFGRMFTAGLAAASAASAGRFGGVLPKVPPFMNRDKGKPGSGVTPGATGADGSLPGGGSGGGGAGVGGVGGVGGGSGTSNAPTGSPSLAGAASTGSGVGVGAGL
ncbi:MAG: WXG100 family type VII secretion target, partial [Actinocatenispora sp.]